MYWLYVCLLERYLKKENDDSVIRMSEAILSSTLTPFQRLWDRKTHFSVCTKRAVTHCTMQRVIVFRNKVVQVRWFSCKIFLPTWRSSA